MSSVDFNQSLEAASSLPLFSDIASSELISLCCDHLKSTNAMQDRALTKTILPLLLDFSHKHKLSGNAVYNYFTDALFHTDNILSRICENRQKPGPTLLALALHDIEALVQFAVSLVSLTRSTGFHETIESMRLSNDLDTSKSASYAAFWELSSAEKLTQLEKQWNDKGAGILTRSHLFAWENCRLIPVTEQKPASLNSIVGCDYQKQTLVANTASFVTNGNANNILLAGSRGTGKSTCVRAVAAQFADSLTTIELTKDSLHTLKSLFDTIRSRGRKFLLFMDDLSFEENEQSFREIKPLLEGLSGSRPLNVLIYATSNRRHLVRETTHSDNIDDIYESDSINETVSLSDRFGITLQFLPPDQEEYLAIVSSIAKEHGIIIDEQIRRSALEWSLSGKGRSGRMARQFINHLLGQRLQ